MVTQVSNNAINGIKLFPLLEIVYDDFSDVSWEALQNEYVLPPEYNKNDTFNDVPNLPNELIMAIKNDNLPKLEEILTRHKTFSEDNYSHQISLLFLAVIHKRKGIIQYLVRNGCNINQADVNGNTSLMICAYHGYLDVSKQLLELGANPNLSDNCGRSPVMVASQQGHKEILKVLLSKGGDVDALTTDGQSALLFSTWKGNVHIASEIIKCSKLGINVVDKNGLTPLMSSALRGDIQMLMFLQRHGADISLKDNEGRTTFMGACVADNPATVRHLIKHGANINEKCNKGITALIYAAAASNTEIVSCLMEQDVCEIDHETNFGATALIVSAQVGDLESVKYLSESAVIDYENMYGKTALMAAAEGGNLDILKHLVDSGAVLSKRSKDGIGAIHLAMVKRLTEITEYLQECGQRMKDDDIIMSCILGDAEAVSNIIRRKENPDYRDELGRTPLMAASYQGHQHIVLHLLDCGVEINQKDGNGISAIGYAIQGKQKVVQQCLLQQGALLDLPDVHGKTILVNCVLTNNLDCLKELAYLGSNIYARDYDNKTALMHASENGHFEIVKFLVQEGAKITSLSKENMSAVDYAFINNHSEICDWFKTIEELADSEKQLGMKLLEAAKEGNAEELESFLKEGGDVNYTSPDGTTVLMDAVQNDNIRTLQKLLLHKPRTNFRNPANGRTAIFKGCLTGSCESIRCLLENGASANIPDKQGRTPLMCAAQENYLKIMEFLIHYQANLNARDEQGWSALCFAAKRNNVEAAQLLLQNGSWMDIQDRTGTTPLGLAAYKGKMEMVQFFIEKGADMDHQDYKGRTALMDACQEGKVKVVTYMLSKGVRTDVISDKGLTALDLAGLNKHTELVDILQRHGAPFGTVIEESLVKALGSTTVEEVKSRTSNKIINMMDIERGVKMADQNRQTIHEKKLVYDRKNEYRDDKTESRDKPSKIEVEQEELTKTQINIFQLCTEGFNGDFFIDSDTALTMETDIDTPNDKGVPPVLCAIGNRQNDVAMWLINKGANVNIQDIKGCTPLMLAVLNENSSMIRFLMEKQSDVNLQDVNGLTAIHYACQDATVSVVDELLCNKAHVDSQDTKGITALMMASREGKLDTVKCLLKHHASMYTRDEDKRTALAYCAMGSSMNCADIVKILCDNGADVHSIDKNEETPLMLSLLSGNITVLEELLHRGSDINHINVLGEMFLLQVCMQEDIALLRLLLDYLHNIKTEIIIITLQYLLSNQCFEYISVLLQNDICNEIYLNNFHVLIPSITKWNSVNDLELLQRYEMLPVANIKLMMAMVLGFVREESVEIVSLWIKQNLNPMEQDDLELLNIINACLNEGHYDIAERILKCEAVPDYTAVSLDLSYNEDEGKAFEVVSEGKVIPVCTRKILTESNNDGNGSTSTDELTEGNEQPTRNKDRGEVDINIEKCQDGLTKALHQHSKLKESVNAATTRQKVLSENLKEVQATYKYYTEKKKKLQELLKEKDEDLSLAKLKNAQLKEQLKDLEATKAAKAEMEHGTHGKNKKSNDIMQLLQPSNAGSSNGEHSTADISSERDALDKLTKSQLMNKTMDIGEMLSSINKRPVSDHNTGDQGEDNADIEVIKTPGVIKDEQLNSQKYNQGSCKVLLHDHGSCTICTTILLEQSLIETHGSNKPCGQCTTCLNAKSIMINYLGYEGEDSASSGKKGYEEEYKGNERRVTHLFWPEKPYPKMYLFRFHYSVSQSMIDGRKDPSTACAIIAMLFAHKFTLDPSVFPEKPPISDVPDKVFDQVEESIREGNETHSINFEGQPVNLGPDEVSLLTSHLGIQLVEETDVDTREPDTLIKHIMNLKEKQVILFIKNFKVVSIMPCNGNKHVLLFDSHPHFEQPRQGPTKVLGSYIFYAKKEEYIIKEMIKSYDWYCDPIPFYGKFAIFDI